MRLLMDLSIIIVNWNSADYLKDCLLSIIHETRDVNYEIIVVDNASYDAAGDIIKKEFPSVKFIQSHENGGFARANNIGFKQSSGRNLLFINPDTRVIGSAINVMLSYLESIPDVGAVGCKLLYSDLSLQLHSVQPYPTIFNQLFDIDFFKNRYPKWKLWGIRPLVDNSGSPERVEVVPGTCIMVKREIFEEVGLFSEDYFMYAEDIDLCYKINHTGSKVYFISGAEVVHHGGASSRNGQVSFFQTVLMRESVYNFILKTKGKATALTYRMAMSIAAIAHFLLLTGALPWMRWNGQRETVHQTFAKWKKVLRWSVGLEKWARELR
jgi:GT2 family glycosyltransferase